ncbi:TPA: hypothetical protein ACGC1O_004934 [Bacillus cereus]|uniref:hypothetical protein n=1 Tax=Bacillus thuringiensis TaxID=1428 RepID=UPI000BF5200F|nr:hypothetical protein [Bacillus thuringiensis]PFU01397.1 hypothetical protein COK75_17805 [Bacillus thuringiensis]
MHGFGVSKEQQMIQELAFVLNKRNYTHKVVNNTKVIVTHEHDGRVIECTAIDGAYVITCNVARNTTKQRKTLQGAINIITTALNETEIM